MSSSQLKVEQILEMLGLHGAVGSRIKGYEARAQQLEMTRDVIESFNNDQIALIEAGTGTGKSLAYLLPAILWAVKNQEKTVISTHTINLQEQLLHKDIPFLLKALQIEMKVALVKGMNNYLCLRKLEDAAYEKPLLTPQEVDELEKIEVWSQSAQEGSKAELPFLPLHSTWEKVGAEGDACHHSECPHFKNCFFFKARKEAADAKLLVVNHHLLCADLKSRAEASSQNQSVLPPYQRLVVDEAHHLEDVATEFFASRISRWDLMRHLARISSEKKNAERTGKLTLLRRKLHECYFDSLDSEIQDLLTRLDIQLPGEKQQLNLLLQDTFQTIVMFLNLLSGRGEAGSVSEESDEAVAEHKWRIRQEHLENAFWCAEVEPQIKALITALQRYAQSLVNLEADLQLLANDQLNEKTKSTRIDLQALSQRLSKISETLGDFLAAQKAHTAVKWIEKRPMKTLVNIHLVDANLDIAERLAKQLFQAVPTVVLCSATLTANRRFDFMRKRLGLTEEHLPSRAIIERVYESPFNYESQALLVIPTDMPNPSDTSFTRSASEEIWRAIQASRGHAFVLFTSFSMLKMCYNALKQRLEEAAYPVFLQGEDQRQALLQKFKDTPRSILFGTDSFWEGVDVVGDALRCVIIVKLPFKVPSEPIIQARTEAISADGGNPFLEYTVPQAIVKFKQGFGRLIRNRYDRGCIVCLDPRLLNKGYGKLFLESLPKCSILFDRGETLSEKMVEFYKKTYRLTLQGKK